MNSVALQYDDNITKMIHSIGAPGQVCEGGHGCLRTCRLPEVYVLITNCGPNVQLLCTNCGSGPNKKISRPLITFIFSSMFKVDLPLLFYRYISDRIYLTKIKKQIIYRNVLC